jgi:ammonium transporter, Amt family
LSSKSTLTVAFCLAVHLGNGIWGILAVGLFAKGELMDNAGYVGAHEGLFYELGSDSFDFNLMLAQLAGMAYIIGWVTVLMAPFFLILNRAGMFRVDALDEQVGLDISHHRGAGYDYSGARQEDVEQLLEARVSRQGKVEVPKEVEKAADDSSSA